MSKRTGYINFSAIQRYLEQGGKCFNLTSGDKCINVIEFLNKDEKTGEPITKLVIQQSKEERGEGKSISVAAVREYKERQSNQPKNASDDLPF